MERLAALYPQAGHNAKTLNAVAWEWARLLDAWDVNHIEFRNAMTVVKSRCCFFPTPGDLKKAIDTVREKPPRVPEDRRLPAYTFGPIPEEQREKTRRAIEIITAQMTGKTHPDDAARQIAELGFAERIY